MLILGIAWKIQEQAYGGLSATDRRRLHDLASTLARDGDIPRDRVVGLKPGARLVRGWGGQHHVVNILDQGFEWQGKTWASLSAIARAITGARWSGPRFFGLAGHGRTAPAQVDG